MQQILSMQATEGMVLAKEVQTAEGRVLCGKGTTLTPAILDRIIKMDISQITVKGHPVKVEGEKSLKQELEDIEKRFSRVTKVAPLMYLKKRIMQRIVASRKGG